MTEFFHSWAFAFILGCFAGGMVGFFVAALCAVSGRASRMEEEIEAEIMTQGKPEDA